MGIEVNFVSECSSHWFGNVGTDVGAGVGADVGAAVLLVGACVKYEYVYDVGACVGVGVGMVGVSVKFATRSTPSFHFIGR